VLAGSINFPLFTRRANLRVSQSSSAEEAPGGAIHELRYTGPVSNGV
jgi:hypothetical protein